MPSLLSHRAWTSPSSSALAPVPVPRRSLSPAAAVPGRGSHLGVVAVERLHHHLVVGGPELRAREARVGCRVLHLLLRPTSPASGEGSGWLLHRARGGCSCPASSPEMQREQPRRGPAGGGRHWRLLVFPRWFQMGLLAVDLAILHTHPPLPPWALPPQLDGASWGFPHSTQGFNGAKKQTGSSSSTFPSCSASSFKHGVTSSSLTTQPPSPGAAVTAPLPPRAAHRSPRPCPRPVGWSRERVIKRPAWLACAQPVPSRCRSSRVAARNGQGLASGRPPGLRKAPGGRQPPLPIPPPPVLIPVPVPHGPYRPTPDPLLPIPAPDPAPDRDRAPGSAREAARLP